jgi:hypothetical protein
MSNYNNGKIYKLVSKFTDMIYIGSTVQTLQRRLIIHKYETRHNFTNSSANMFIWDDCEIQLIENYPCNSKNELVEREQYYIDLHKDYCINLRNAVRDKEEYKRKRRNREKLWTIENREKQKEKRRNRYNKVKNTEEYKLERKQYRDDHKPEISVSNKLYKQYLNSMGGDPRFFNCLARIDPTLFS